MEVTANEEEEAPVAELHAATLSENNNEAAIAGAIEEGLSALRPKKEGFYRQAPDKRQKNPIMGRGMVFRRKKPPATSDDSPANDQPTNSFDSAESRSKRTSLEGGHTLSPLPEEDSSSLRESRSEASMETSDEPYSGLETSDPNFGTDSPDTHLSDREGATDNDDAEIVPISRSTPDFGLENASDDEDDDEGHDAVRHLHPGNPSGWTPREPIPRLHIGLSRKQAVSPGISNITDDDGDFAEFSDEDVVGEQIQRGIGKEKRNIFHIPKLKMPRKRGSGEFALTSPTKQNQSLDISSEAGSEEFTEWDGNSKTAAAATTTIRHRGFGRKKNKAVAHPAEVGNAEIGEAKKGLHLRLPRGRKANGGDEPTSRPKIVTNNGDEQVLRSFGVTTPKKQKAGDKLRRKLKIGKHAKKDSLGEDEEWGFDSDSEEFDTFDTSHARGNRSFGEDSAMFDYDGSDLHAGDLLKLPTCGVMPPPVKDGVAVRNRRQKDRKELRVKPLHCFMPHKVFMSEDEIYQNMLQPSEKVEHVESFVEPWYKGKPPELTEMEQAYWGTPMDGRIGSLRAEVLSCVGLAKNKADVSVYLVCGDAAFATDVIHGSRSPMWPACSKRAACFPIHHAYARLYVGIFDVSSKRTSDNDQFCGRVTIDISALRPDSEYDVTLPLRASSFVYDRQPRGVVRLRFSLHWFSERAAVLSYLRAPRNMASTPAFREQPSIPCADPKTFRNVAVTLHGQELPGKYSRPAFRATMREFALYQLNIRFLAKTMLRDAVLYENPVLSLYIFLGWMHCIYYSSVRLVPVYITGFLIFLLLDGYFQHGTNTARNMGYSPVSLQEMLLALLSNSQSRQLNPLLTEKVAKATESRETEDEAEPFDHREFPFSDRNAYKKPQIEAALVMRSKDSRKERREELKFEGRMSVYVKTQNSMDSDSNGSIYQPFDGDESVVTNVANDNETVQTEEGDRDFDSENELDLRGDEDNVFGLDSDEDEEENLVSSLVRTASNNSRSSVVLGPPQDTNVKPKKKIPPQVHLARFEEKLNKVTASLSMDKVFSSTLAYRHDSKAEEGFRSVMGAHHHPIHANGNAKTKKKEKRIPLDDFDKKLGYRVRHPNPVTEITSSFLGPLMRIFRILCVVVRVVFNVGVWSDPYLSFWVLCFLVLLMLVLILFPWRLFLFAIGLIGFGPQNIFLRKKFEQKEEVKVEEAPEVETDAMSNSGTISDDGKKVSRRRRQNPLAKLKEHRQKKLAEKQELQKDGLPASLTTSLADLERSTPSLDNRQPFAATTKATKKQVEPREIVVPYTRFRKERFFDWPPNPTVARATPVRFDDCHFDMSFTSLASEKDSEDYANLRRSTLM